LYFLANREVKMPKFADALDVRSLELTVSAATVITESIELLVERPEQAVVTTHSCKTASSVNVDERP
jgi:hypothetical protein